MKLTTAVCTTVIGFALMAPAAFAAHPLITDDTGTQGPGNFQVEVNAEVSWNRSAGVKEAGGEVAVAVCAGVGETVDLVLGLPWQRSSVEEGGMTETTSGLADMTVELKWRLLERRGFSLAVKPGVSLPTGSDDRGLGNGRPGYAVTLIASQSLDPLTFHANVGYGHNDFSLREVRQSTRADVWSGSVAVTAEVLPGVQLVGNIGGETPSDRSGNAWPAFALAGVICSINENWDIDAGARFGLGPAESDAALLFGTAFRF